MTSLGINVGKLTSTSCDLQFVFHHATRAIERRNKTTKNGYFEKRVKVRDKNCQWCRLSDIIDIGIPSIGDANGSKLPGFIDIDVKQLFYLYSRCQCRVFKGCFKVLAGLWLHLHRVSLNIGSLWRFTFLIVIRYWCRTFVLTRFHSAALFYFSIFLSVHVIKISETRIHKYNELFISKSNLKD